MEARTTLTGNIGVTPVRKTTPRGEVTEFTVAHSDHVRTEDGVWTDTAPVWYRVSVWGRLGANAARSLQKGQRVVVHGDAERHDWTGDDGVPRSEMRMRATAVGHDLTWGTSVFTKLAPASRPQAADAVAPAEPQPAPPAGDWGGLVPAGASPTAWAEDAGIADDQTPF